MVLVAKRTNLRLKTSTNLPDVSALIPVLPGTGPRTKELYLAIRTLIETGQTPPGTKLPTTRDLSRRFGLSRAAAVAAFELLISDGFVRAKVGAGTFVAPDVPVLAAAVASSVPRAATPQTLPGTVGIAIQDAQTQRVFRMLLSRHLSRPGPEHFRYGNPRGGLVLREAIAAYLRSARGVRCHPDQIVVTAGTQHALDLIARATIRPGDAVWLEDPCYPKARAILASAGARLVGIPVDGEGLDVEHGATQRGKVRAVYVTPSHQYPLGVTMTMRRRMALIDWARKNDAWIIEDDYDSEFRYSGPPLTALQGIDGSGRVAYLGTFSKVLFPGLRVGYAVLPQPLLDAVIDIRARSDGQPPTLAEGALADLLNEGHFAAHLRRSRRRAEAARDALVSGLRTYCGTELNVSTPNQGLHLVATLQSKKRDEEVVAAAEAAGVGARALSSMFIIAPPRQGLVMGFSGFAPDALYQAARKLGTLLNDIAASPGNSPDQPT